MMRLLGRIIRRLAPPPDPTSGGEVSEARLREAQERLAETHRLGAEVRQVAERSRQLRRENQFSKRISGAMGKVAGQ